MIFLDPFNLIQLFLWIAVVTVLFIFSYMNFAPIWKEEEIKKNFNITVGLIFIGLGFLRLLLIFHDYFVIFYQNPIIWYLAHVFVFIFAIPFVVWLENQVIKTSKYIISIIATSLFSVYIIGTILVGFDVLIMQILIMPAFGTIILAILCTYIYLIIKSGGEIRKRSIYVLIGIFSLTLFWFMHWFFGPLGFFPIPTLKDIIAIVSPIGIIISGYIGSLGLHFRPEILKS